MQVYDDDDLYGGQWSAEFKCGRLCAIITISGKRSLLQVQNDDDDDLRGGQEVKGQMG